MTDLLLQIVFGWPFVILSLLVSLIGLITKRHPYLFVAAALILPFSVYLIGYPFVRGWSLALPLCQVASAFAIRNQKVTLAWSLFLLPLLAIAWLAFLVLSQ
ncbi:MAG: hypothetical protein AB1649_22335 [Chloroflexota bacterium]